MINKKDLLLLNGQLVQKIDELESLLARCKPELIRLKEVMPDHEYMMTDSISRIDQLLTDLTAAMEGE